MNLKNKIRKIILNNSDKRIDECIDYWYQFLEENKNNKEINWYEKCDIMLDNFTNAYYWIKEK